jgi:hypothetical protein
MAGSRSVESLAALGNGAAERPAAPPQSALFAPGKVDPGEASIAPTITVIASANAPDMNIRVLIKRDVESLIVSSLFPQ